MANDKELEKLKTKESQSKEKDKKKSALAAARANQNRTTLKEYFRGVRVEMKKVVWPTPRELMSYTWTVVFTCFAFGVIFWVADSAFMQALQLALGFSFN
jgi:preprotein translocase subunit SecE